jgi:hypothetical protein
MKRIEEKSHEVIYQAPEREKLTMIVLPLLYTTSKLGLTCQTSF